MRLDQAPRQVRRHALAIERQASRTGVWPEWVHHHFASGSVGRHGWSAEIRDAYSNGLYAVLVRRLPTGVTHLAIRTPSNLEPPWRDLQRIKNELFGPERYAVQVCPAESRLIDQADMYHLWVMPEGHVPTFGLHQDDEGRADPEARR